MTRGCSACASRVHADGGVADDAIAIGAGVGAGRVADDAGARGAERARRDEGDRRRNVAAHADAVRAHGVVEAARVAAASGASASRSVARARRPPGSGSCRTTPRSAVGPVGGGGPRAPPRRRAPRIPRSEPAQHDRGQAQLPLARGDQRQQHLDRVLVIVGLAVGRSSAGASRAAATDEGRVDRDFQPGQGRCSSRARRPRTKTLPRGPRPVCWARSPSRARGTTTPANSLPASAPE